MASLASRVAVLLSQAVPHSVLGLVLDIIGSFGSSFMMVLDIGIVFNLTLLIGSLSPCQ
jgi:hypothetical protein